MSTQFEFPPPLISKWIKGGTVPTKELIDELAAVLDHSRQLIPYTEECDDFDSDSEFECPHSCCMPTGHSGPHRYMQVWGEK